MFTAGLTKKMEVRGIRQAYNGRHKERVRQEDNYIYVIY